MRKVGSGSIVLLWFLATAVVCVAANGNCSSLELTICVPALTGKEQVKAACCNSFAEHRLCLCGYQRDPNLRQYFNTPVGRNVATACGVPYPNC